MISPDQFIRLIQKEINLIISLSKNIQQEQLSYKPKDSMRSMQELMQYLTGCGYYYAAYWKTNGEISVADYFKEIREKAIPVTLENFEEKMKQELDWIKTLVHSYNQDEWQHKMVKFPWGEEAPLGEAMIETSLKWLTAYKYQLFVYIKISGDIPLSTRDVWVMPL